MNPNSQAPWPGQPEPNPQTPPPPTGPPPATPYTPPAQPVSPPVTAYDPTQPPPDYSIDYLNQIATPIKQKTGPSNFMLIIFGLVAVAILAIVAMLAFNSRTTPLDRATELYVRMDSLRTIGRDQHNHLRDNGLRTTNTSYQLFLSNAIRDIEEPLSAAGINKSTLDAELRSQEQSLVNEYKDQFEDARLNVELDRTYAREMTYQLTLLNSMMETIYNETNTEELKSFLEQTNNNLATIAEDFSNFSTGP